MIPSPANLLLADFFDRFRLQLPDGIVNWLTPVWILCVGAAAGLLLSAIIWIVLKLLSLVPGIVTLAESPQHRRIAIGVLTLIFFGLAIGLYVYPFASKP